MKYVIASFAAAAALLFTTGTASAQHGGSHHSGGHHTRAHHRGYSDYSRYYGPSYRGGYYAPSYGYGASVYSGGGYYAPSVGVYSYSAPIYRRGYSPGCGY